LTSGKAEISTHAVSIFRSYASNQISITQKK